MIKKSRPIMTQKIKLWLIFSSLILLFLLTILRLISGISLLTQIGLTIISIISLFFSVDDIKNKKCFDATNIGGLIASLIILSTTWFGI